MLIVRFLRQYTCGTEEYGKVLYDGQTVRYDGFSQIYIKFFENGISDRRGGIYKPADGAEFMRHLKDSGHVGLTITDTVEF